MIFKIAAEYGQTPWTLLASVTPAQLRQLIAFHRREGFRAERIEMAVAQLCALTVNIHKKKGAKAASRDDFLPFASVWDSILAAVDPIEYEANMIRRELSSQARIVKVDRETRQPISL